MTKEQGIAVQLNEAVQLGLEAQTLDGFVKANQIAIAMDKLSELMTPEYMKPIMKLQGSKLGFRTDKDKSNGYDEPTVKACLIEAVLTGLQPVNNHFNIIAGNMYPTKEGFGELLKNFSAKNKFQYKIIPALPRINADKTSAAIVMKIFYSLNGVENTEELEIPVKMNSMMGTDAVIGKATRKARAWLYNTITGSEIADADVEEVEAEIIQEKEENRKENEKLF